MHAHTHARKPRACLACRWRRCCRSCCRHARHSLDRVALPRAEQRRAGLMHAHTHARRPRTCLACRWRRYCRSCCRHGRHSLDRVALPRVEQRRAGLMHAQTHAQKPRACFACRWRRCCRAAVAMLAMLATRSIEWRCRALSKDAPARCPLTRTPKSQGVLGVSLATLLS